MNRVLISTSVKHCVGRLPFINKHHNFNCKQTTVVLLVNSKSPLHCVCGVGVVGMCVCVEEVRCGHARIHKYNYIYLLINTMFQESKNNNCLFLGIKKMF